MHATLIPFTPCASVNSLDVELTLSRREILCSWDLSGNTDKILWPARNDSPARAMNLWDHTCFEFFIGPTTASHYYEFNLSPGGDWNTFSFSEVRQSMQETTRLVCKHSHCTLTDRHAHVEARLQFDGDGDQFRVGIAAILASASTGRTSAGRTSAGRTFFALVHPGDRPDFHRRDGHNLILERDVK